MPQPAARLAVITLRRNHPHQLHRAQPPQAKVTAQPSASSTPKRSGTTKSEQTVTTKAETKTKKQTSTSQEPSRVSNAKSGVTKAKIGKEVAGTLEITPAIASRQSILTMAQSQLTDKAKLNVHHDFDLKSDDESVKRLCVLSYHIENEQYDYMLVDPKKIKITDYRNLSQLNWVDYKDAISNAKKNQGSKLTDLPLKAGKGDNETLRYRWKLGADVGGSDLYLNILLYIRYRAGKEVDGINKASKLALCEIRAILLYLDKEYRFITEEDIEGIFQEIRARKDPKLLAEPPGKPVGTSDAKSLVSSSASQDAQTNSSNKKVSVPKKEKPAAPSKSSPAPDPN